MPFVHHREAADNGTEFAGKIVLDDRESAQRLVAAASRSRGAVSRRVDLSIVAQLTGAEDCAETARGATGGYLRSNHRSGKRPAHPERARHHVPCCS
jgi:hypothetical protein